MTEQYLQPDINLTSSGSNGGNLNYFDDFIGGNGVGNTGWETTVNGSGVTGNSKWLGPDSESHPGNQGLRVGPAIGDTLLTQEAGVIPRGMNLETQLTLSLLNDPGTDEHSFSFGYNRLATDNAVFFLYDPSSANWQAVVRVGASNVAQIDTGIAVAINTGYRLNVIVNEFANDGAGLCIFQIDGEEVARVEQSPINTSMEFEVFLERTLAGTTGVDFALDYVSATQPLQR